MGRLPADNAIPWRHNALLYEASPNFGFEDLTGGYLNGGVAGTCTPVIAHASRTTHSEAWNNALLVFHFLQQQDRG